MSHPGSEDPPMSQGPTLTVRTWNADEGDPARPRRVRGVPVDHLLAQRTGAPGTLAVLRDGRVALTGSILAVGRHSALRAYVRGRARTIDDPADRRWLDVVSKILEGMEPEAGAQPESILRHRRAPSARQDRREGTVAPPAPLAGLKPPQPAA